MKNQDYEKKYEALMSRLLASKYRFTKEQAMQIRIGIYNGLSISEVDIYAIDTYTSEEMAKIRQKLERKKQSTIERRQKYAIRETFETQRRPRRDVFETSVQKPEQEQLIELFASSDEIDEPVNTESQNKIINLQITAKGAETIIQFLNEGLYPTEAEVTQTIDDNREDRVLTLVWDKKRK